MRYNTHHFIVAVISASGRSPSNNLPLVQEIEHNEQTTAETGTYKFSQICHENRLEREPALKNGLNRSLMWRLLVAVWSRDGNARGFASHYSHKRWQISMWRQAGLIQHDSDCQYGAKYKRKKKKDRHVLHVASIDCAILVCSREKGIGIYRSESVRGSTERIWIKCRWTIFIYLATVWFSLSSEVWLCPFDGTNGLFKMVPSV